MRPLPRGVPRALAALALLTASLSAPTAAGTLGAQSRRGAVRMQPVILTGANVTVAYGAADVLAASGDSATVARALAACRVSSADERVFTRLLVAGDDVARADQVVFVVVPEASVRSECDAAFAHSAPLMSRGIRIAGRPLYDARSDARGATVLAGGRQVKPDAVRLHPTILATPSTDASDWRVPSSLVLLVPVEAVAPDARGRLAPLELHITSADREARPDRFVITAASMRDVWYQLLPARLALMSDEPALTPQAQLPAPADATLRDAHARYGEGRMVEAARAATALLAGESLARDDERVARMMIANALLAHHDSSAARIVLADVLADSPCLRLASAQPDYVRMVDGMRAGPVRCTSVPLAKVAAASLVPGLGQAVIGRRRRALGVAAGTLLFGVTGLYLRGVADDRYDEYHRARTIDQATLKYDRATEFRRASAGAYAVAGALWAVAGVDAVRAERAHRRDVGRVAEDRVALQLLPAATTGGVTMGVAFAW